MVYFVATPIGNLKDITLRALETLREADAIFCEDTRHTVKLLNAYEIKKPLFACHKFNETEAAEKILALSREEKRVAVVSDAGTPVVSDPGNVVCKVLREAGEPFTLIPGASAFVAALVLSALPADRFAFIGFLPDKAGEKRAVLEKYKDLDMTLAFHCAPQRIAASPNPSFIPSLSICDARAGKSVLGRLALKCSLYDVCSATFGLWAFHLFRNVRTLSFFICSVTFGL